MKILWFTNTPALASGKLGYKVVLGGWLSALANKLKEMDQVELSIAFYHHQRMEAFLDDGISFYPLYNGMDRKINRWVSKIRNTDERNSDQEHFMEIIRQAGPDLIHIHGTELGFGKILNRAKVPVVVSVQGVMSVYSHMFYREITREDYARHVPLKDKIKLSPYTRKAALFHKKSQREKEILMNLKYAIGRTGWDRRILRILAPGAKYFHNNEILRDGFYTHVWKPSEQDKFRIFSTGGNAPHKGLKTVVQAVRFLQSGSDLDFEWQIAGVTEGDQYVRMIKRMFGAEYPEQRIQFLGSLTEDVLIQRLLEANLFVLSSHIENSSNSLCEAMILGLPCIATCSGGTQSLLENGKEGIIVQDGDPWALAGSIIEISENSERALALGNNGRERALLRHNPDHIIQELVNIYNNIIQMHKG